MRVVRNSVMAVLVCAAATAPAPSAQAGAELNGTDPRESGCARDSVITATIPLTDPSGAPTRLVLTVRRSPGCDTRWIDLVNPYPSGYAQVETSIAVAYTDITSSHTGTATGLHRSPQVFAPGRTCIEVGAVVTGAGGVLAGGAEPTTFC
ncbi:hypothetical protein [Nocardia asteroides]|uniref:hypothetical protein n=1 Tax=Nocardia asteroides TaxID=1824 RepID=UPI001E6185D6|nr:hypothetical protein [Nocardia asteroides]UGT61717.1 hypothetical protein LTT61_32215 [Nocardia asteroides]